MVSCWSVRFHSFVCHWKLFISVGWNFCHNAPKMLTFGAITIGSWFIKVPRILVSQNKNFFNFYKTTDGYYYGLQVFSQEMTFTVSFCDASSAQPAAAIDRRSSSTSRNYSWLISFIVMCESTFSSVCCFWKTKNTFGQHPGPIWVRWPVTLFGRCKVGRSG